MDNGSDESVTAGMLAEALDRPDELDRPEEFERTEETDWLERLVAALGDQLGADHVYLHLYYGEHVFNESFHHAASGNTRGSGPIFSVGVDGVTFQGQRWNFPIIVHDLQRARIPSELALELAVRRVRSCGIFTIELQGRQAGVIECYFQRSFHRWRQEDLVLVTELNDELTVRLSPHAGSAHRLEQPRPDEEIRSQYRRLARYGNLVVLSTNNNFEITDVVGSTEELLGLRSSEMMRDVGIWERLLHRDDASRLRRLIIRLKRDRQELWEEIRINHQRSGETRWLMLKALPRVTPDGDFIGWEGFGIDITDRRRIQEELRAQNRRLEAVFEVSRVLQGQANSVMVTFRGLRALVKATRSDCGYACFYDRDRDQLEAVASHGLSERYLEGLSAVLKGPSLLRHVISAKRGLFIDDIQNDPRASLPLARLEGLHATLVVPLILESEVYGAIAIFKREVGAYSSADFDLVSAAALQLTLGVRQADRYESEKRHSQSLRALYRISHELAKYRTPREIAEHAFPVLQQEFGLKRMWFGVLNDQGTHLVGKAGFGPGVRRQLQEVQIEINLRHDFLDEAIRSHRPVVVPEGEHMECSSLNRVIKRLKLETFIIIPLVSLNQVVGVLIVEPTNPQESTRESRLQLIASMGNEMATVIMARRFEAKMAEALKMRMAGLLASGVAHNFNNLLQAILGQVALIEMHLPKGSPATDATRLITESTKRGASLVSQLLNFAAQGQSSRHTVTVDRLLEDSRELYRSLLGTNVEFDLQLRDEGATVVADTSQLQQVITNVLANAKDAITTIQGPKVTISTRKVRLRSAEVDPELAPGHYVRLDIQDNGVGMDAEQQSRCFEPFFTTKNVDQGTGVGISGSGLGLSAAYSLIKQHDGLITVHSSPGEGAVFSIYLPFAGGASETSSTVSSNPSRSTKLSRGGVILLGIDQDSHPVVNSVLESMGFQVKGAFDVIQAIELLQRPGQEWRHVLIDLDRAPNGIDTCTKLLNEIPDVTVVGIATDAKESSIGFPQSNRLTIIEKPFGVWSMDAAISRLTKPEVQANGGLGGAVEKVASTEEEKAKEKVDLPSSDGGVARVRGRVDQRGRS